MTIGTHTPAPLKKFITLFWVVVLLTTSLAIPERLAYGVEVGGIMAAADEGDDRIRPAAGLHLGINDRWMGRMFYYGRSNGPVTESTMAVGGGYRYPVFKHFRGNAGLSILMEQTEIYFSDYPEESGVVRQWNFGGAFGVSYDVQKFKPLYLSFGLDMHVYFGGTAGLYLTVARKQFLSMAAGVQF